MAPQTAQVLSDALSLPEPDRALIVQQLLETLSADEPELSDEELAVELDRRSKELRQDSGAGIRWEDLKREVLG